MSTVRILMCAPDHYEVTYEINPWMTGNVHASTQTQAAAQWQRLFEVLQELAAIDLVAPQAGWPDMVFTANAGLVLEQQVVLSRFRHAERRGEEPFFQDWFAENGFTVRLLPDDVSFEGAGDALFDRRRPILWAGYGFRSDLAAHPMIADWLDVEIASVELVDPRFYHLDTCFCPLAGGHVLYFPPAFSDQANAMIEARIPDADRIVLPEADALKFAGNAVNVGDKIVMSRASDALQAKLGEHGYEVRTTALDEFLKAGGAAKCLTLRTTESR